jgi:hypothetical protein
MAAAFLGVCFGAAATMLVVSIVSSRALPWPLRANPSTQDAPPAEKTPNAPAPDNTLTTMPDGSNEESQPPGDPESER